MGIYACCDGILGEGGLIISCNYGFLVSSAKSGCFSLLCVLASSLDFYMAENQLETISRQHSGEHLLGERARRITSIDFHVGFTEQ